MLVESGDFPPCPRLNLDETNAVRLLTKYEKKEVTQSVMNKLVLRDAKIVGILARQVRWCQAYEARIGIETN